jgi:3-oxoacyl-[acyl-carrier protein] reductase
MNLDLHGKHALVCGASQGIGHAAAVALAELGADVTVLARSRAALEVVVAALPRGGAQSHAWIDVDMSDAAPLRAKVEACANTRPITILVNNTGGPASGPAHSAEAASFVAAFGQHLLANHVLLQAVLPGMQRARWGRVVNVISTSVKEPVKGLGVSNTIRGAVASWAKTLAGELGPFGITVNNVLPGYTTTQRLEQILQDRARASGKTPAEVAAAMLASVPAGRFADASEVAAAIAFLASPAAGYINGINLPVDGGRMQSL